MMGIILLESPNPGQTRKGSGQFVSVQSTKISKSNREFSKRSEMFSKHKAMTRTIHGFHSKALIFYFEHKHILFVFGIMT